MKCKNQFSPDLPIAGILSSGAMRSFSADRYKSLIFHLPIMLKQLFIHLTTVLFISVCTHFSVLAQTPVMKWDFETIRNRLAVESSGNIGDTIEGNFETAEGVV